MEVEVLVKGDVDGNRALPQVFFEDQGELNHAGDTVATGDSRCQQEILVLEADELMQVVNQAADGLLLERSVQKILVWGFIVNK